MADASDLALAVGRYFALNGQTCEQDPDTGTFLFSFPVPDLAEEVLRGGIRVLDKGLVLQIPLPAPCREDCLYEAAFLIACINHRLARGRLDLDPEGGTITYLSVLEAEGDAPSYEKMESLILTGQTLMQAFSGALVRVGQGLSEAEDEIEISQ